MITKKEDYNNVPVKYCTYCLDIKILLLTSGKDVQKDIEYCGKCGSSDIEESHVNEWEKKYEELYGKPYFTRDK